MMSEFFLPVGFLAFWSPGPVEMMLLAAVALLLYGGDLPNVARSWGKSLSEFRRGLSGTQNELNDVIYGDPEPESSAVVLERRMSQVVVEPYVASECTTDRARSLRRRMECVQVLRLIGTPDVAETTTN